MENKYLIVVDMQNDFVDGALGTPEAQQIVSAVSRKIQEFSGKIIFTMDTHDDNYLTTQEGSLLPVKHCIKGTKGWKLAPAIAEQQQAGGWPVYEKPVFGSVRLANDLAAENAAAPITEIELIGLCTDICVVSNAVLLKSSLPDTIISVDASCCAGVNAEKHNAALLTMDSCQIKLKGMVK